jgi:hypothetical protein
LISTGQSHDRTPDLTTWENQPGIEQMQNWLVMPIIASEQVIGLVEFESSALRERYDRLNPGFPGRGCNQNLAVRAGTLQQ